MGRIGNASSRGSHASRHSETCESSDVRVMMRRVIHVIRRWYTISQLCASARGVGAGAHRCDGGALACAADVAMTNVVSKVVYKYVSRIEQQHMHMPYNMR